MNRASRGRNSKGQIDESLNTSNDCMQTWVFGIYDRGTKDTRMFVIGNDISGNKLFLIIEELVYNNEIVFNREIE